MQLHWLEKVAARVRTRARMVERDTDIQNIIYTDISQKYIMKA